jgi:hypothetical protein
MDFVCYAEWNQLPESTESLFSTAANDSIFFSRIWFENLLRHAPADRRSTLLACVVEDDNLLALLPLELRSGQHWYSLTNLYSSLSTLLLAEQGQQEVIECLVSGLSQMPFSSLRLDPIAENDRNLQGFQQAMESVGIPCHRTFRFHNWIHRTQGQSFHDYMAARPARVRGSIARKERKLAREHGYTIRLFTDSGLQQAMADYNAVYNRSWKANELYGGFIEGLVCGLSEQGWLRLAILYVDETPVAAQLWSMANGKASIFKLAHDENWKRYSPGSILTKYLMKHVIDNDKATEIDFLTGNDAYKQDWMSERRERWTLYCINRPKPKQKVSRVLEWICRLR